MKKLCNRLVILFAVLLALPVCAENKFCEVGFNASSTVLIPKTARHT